MNFKEKDLIIFDLDGTLINSIPDLTLAINKMLLYYQLPSLTLEEVTPFVGNGAKPLVQRALKHTRKEKEISEKLIDEAFKIYLAAYKEAVCQETFLYPKVLKTLKYLDKKGYNMAICTNKPFNLIAPILDALKIKQFFKIWIGEDSLSEKKPSAIPLLHIIKEMNTTIEKSLMVGDSKNDILASKNANVQSIGVSYGYNYNEHIGKYNPTFVVDSFAELQNLF
ncbi:phosphoglycolate phosphatase [uncultured Polaribacter sp.]|uniref:phosphoglycolate phosphatase n=1 Tax=uncultured Polaribacter sp. TaxID=174711 RepID=UPI0030DBBB72|tara:strand:- start:5181 stop:5852 length:672 start_codon:yes stop_codon:yes gene_type:complete